MIEDMLRAAALVVVLALLVLSVVALTTPLADRLQLKLAPASGPPADAPAAVVTRLGAPAEYRGHTILLEGVETVSSFWLTGNRLLLRVDGADLVLDPGRRLAPGAFSFYLPDGEKLTVKSVSHDLATIEWARVAD